MNAFKNILFIFAILLSFTLSAEEEEAPSPAEKSPYRATSRKPHDMRIINSGSAALYARIDMIRRAEKSIEIETFIFNDDTSGRLLMRELIAAAKRGVKVRVLVDKAINNIKLDGYHATLLKEAGVDLRFYNDSSILNISTVQYRNHRKLLVCDDKEAISGGRNIADEYYDLNEKFNFLDRDTTIEGDLVPVMRESFDKFWESAMTETPKKMEEPDKNIYVYDEGGGDGRYHQDKSYYDYKMKNARKLFDVSDEDEKKLKFIMDVGKKNFEAHEVYKCPELSFASDKEGAGFKESLSSRYKRRFRHLRKELSKWMRKKAQKEITIDTPYFLESEFTSALDVKLEDNIKVNLLTNSLATTDAIHVSSVFHNFVSRFTGKESFKAYTYKGQFSGEGELYSDKIKNSVWGTHSKTMLFDDDSFMIGTINMDNRSNYYNTELALFCSGGKELAQDIRKSIQTRMNGSNRLNTNADPDDCSDPFEQVSTSKKTLYYLLKLPSHLLQFLL